MPDEKPQTPSDLGNSQLGPLGASIVILSYNSASYLGPCLHSVARLAPPPAEIIVVDNASQDDSVKVAQVVAAELGLEICMIPLAGNLGCAGGNNVGWRATRGDIVIFLNPDTEVSLSFVGEVAAAFATDERIGIVGAKIFYPNSNRLQHAGAIIHPNGQTNHFGAGETDNGQFDEPRECDYVTGAGFAVRRQVLTELGGFDEDFYPAYFEEVDFCTRARKRGWRVLYWPRATMVHHESVSLGMASERFLRLYHRMRMRYCAKHFTWKQWLREFLPRERVAWRLSSAIDRRAMRAAYLDLVRWRLTRRR